MGAMLATENREELSRIDTKSSILLGAATVAAGSIVGGILAGQWSPFRLHAQIAWLWWLGVAVATVGYTALLVAVYPMMRRTAGQDQLTYFGHIARVPRTAEVRRLIERMATDPLERSVEQTLILARLIRIKYALIRLGVLSGVVGAGCCSIAVLINHQLH